MNECIYHEGYDEDDCPLCQMELNVEMDQFESDDVMKWASFVGFILEMKERGEHHFKVNITKGNRDILTIECGEDSLEIEIS